jgi:hypothetical protein
MAPTPSTLQNPQSQSDQPQSGGSASDRPLTMDELRNYQRDQPNALTKPSPAPHDYSSRWDRSNGSLPPKDSLGRFKLSYHKDAEDSDAMKGLANDPSASPYLKSLIPPVSYDQKREALQGFTGYEQVRENSPHSYRDLALQFLQSNHLDHGATIEESLATLEKRIQEVEDRKSLPSELQDPSDPRSTKIRTIRFKNRGEATLHGSAHTNGLYT